MHDELLEHLSCKGGPVTLRGSSMAPLYPQGTRIEVAPACAEDLIVGDLVLVKMERHLRLHRFIGRDALGRILTLGDACWVPDAPLQPSALVGRAVPARGGWRGASEWLLRRLALWRGRLLETA